MVVGGWGFVEGVCGAPMEQHHQSWKGLTGEIQLYLHESLDDSLGEGAALGCSADKSRGLHFGDHLLE